MEKITQLIMKSSKLASQRLWLEMCNEEDMELLTESNLNEELDDLKLKYSSKLNTNEQKTFRDNIKMAVDCAMDHYMNIIAEDNIPTEIVFNPKAFVNITGLVVPDNVKLALSLGNKFAFPIKIGKNNIDWFIANIENLVDKTMPIESASSCKSYIGLNLKLTKQTGNHIKNWLMFMTKRMEFYFKTNKLMATPSDKGSHTVLLTETQYTERIRELLSSDTYELANNTQLNVLISREKAYLMSLKKNIHTKKFLTRDTNTVCNFAKFYILPKIHKNNFPGRPITSTKGSPGYHLARVMANMLSNFFPASKYQIKNSYDIPELIQNVRVNDDEKLTSFDIVGMYTNIPVSLAIELITIKTEIWKKLDLNTDFVKRVMTFLLSDCAVFQYDKEIYKQCDGLAMGSCISPILARIVMDHIFITVLDSLKLELKFLTIFVDDSMTIVNELDRNKLLKGLNGFHHKINFTCEIEQDGLIDFLETTIVNDNGQLFTNFYRKTYGSGRLVNYYSNHSQSTILNTAIQFIKKVLFLSDGCFFELNKEMVKETLRLNSFPETDVIRIIEGNYSYMYAKEKNKYNNTDTSFPITEHSDKVVKLIKSFGLPINTSVVYSTRHARSQFIRRHTGIKDKWKNVNQIALFSCKCGRTNQIAKTKRNERAEDLLKKLRSDGGKCNKFSHNYPARKTTLMPAINKLTNDPLANQIAWNFRNKLTNNSFQFNNKHLRKIAYP